VLTLADNYLIPKALIHSDRYKNLQTDAAVLYAVLYDKSIVSDEDDGVLLSDDGRRLFINSPVGDIIAGLDFVDKRAEILLRELDCEGLIKVVGQADGSHSGITVFPVSEGTGSPAYEKPDSPACEKPDSPACEKPDSPACEKHDSPAYEKPDSPPSEKHEHREASSVKLRYIGPTVVAEPCEVVTDPTITNDSANYSDNADSAPLPVSNRIIALQGACNYEFSPSDVRELWISMQDVIDEARWDDLDFLSVWLRSMYREMHSRVAGGDRFVRIALLHDLIGEK